MGDHLEHAFLPGQQGLAPTQGRLGPLAVLDIATRAIPVHDVAQLVAPRHHLEEEPAIGAVAASPAGFDLPRLPSSEAGVPHVHHPPAIVGMQGDVPSPAVCLLR